jgi:small-conductance mechanosensitive channel
MNSRTYLFILLIIFITPPVWSQDSVAKDSVTISSNELSNWTRKIAASDSLRKIDSGRIANLDLIVNQMRIEELERQRIAASDTNSLTSQSTLDKIDSLKRSLLGAPVLLYGDTIFFVYTKHGPLNQYERAEKVRQKLEQLIDEHIFRQESVTIQASEDGHDILHEENVLLTITKRDALIIGTSTEALARNYKDLILSEVSEYYEETGLFQMLLRIGILIGVILLFIVGIRYLNKGFTWLNIKAIKKSKKYLKGIHFKNYEFLSIEQEVSVLKWLLKVVKWITILILVYASLPIVFSIFPATKGIATALLDYVLDPLMSMGLGFVQFIPELITILVIGGITHYFLRFLNFLAHEVAIGKLVLPGFYPDWAFPTFNLLRIFIYAFAFIIIFPYLPGSDSTVFRGVSVFLGLLISIGSSSAIGNIVAGLVITYMRAFKPGDRVKIGDAVGDVIEKTMLVTRLRTIKNEEVTIPNSAILNSNTINYSTSAKELGLILNTEVTIGYDVPWRKVHELLIQAAKKTDKINANPEPFVLQTALSDFYVSYQLNAYTDDVGVAARIYSELHSNIQDCFNEAGVEILSPHYQMNREE